MRTRFALAALLLSACREEGVTRTRVPKAESATVVAEAPHDHAHDHEHASGPQGVRWTLPSGWKEVPGNGMRLATFVPPGGVKAEGTVVALPGNSGNELDNANRWGGFVRERGIMLMAIFGNIIVNLSWFGVNMLGIGLHSYGFMDKAFLWLSTFCALQLAFMALGALPARFWMENRADA